MKDKQYNYLLHVLLPVLIGCIIYFFYRNTFITERTNITSVPNWIKYNLPDGLWFYALLSSLIFIWNKKLSFYFGLWFLSTIALGFLSEILQAQNIIRGTFDWKDLLTYFIATAICVFHLPHFYKSLLFNPKTPKQ
ncbi:MAG: hypothetical protein HY841_11665 [Bacteroidetes bacterium]|nr:hypothetical protein [Bacteroidota bacterium]